MKWLNPNGATQHTADKRYCVVQATEGNWIAYELGQTTGEELGVKPTDAEARQVCEEHEELLITMRRRA